MLSVYTIPATFFVVGTQVERHPDTIRRMLAEGHEVGNHSYSHSALRKLSHEEQEMDLRKLDVRLRELGAKPRFVRPPYGFYDHNTVNAVQDLNGQLVMWSVDSQDWRKKDLRNDILSSMQTLYSGAPLRGVFLFHDTHRMTIENMPQIVDALKASGCRFVTLSEYIDAPWLQPDADPMQTALPDTPQPLAADATPAASSNAVQANQQAVSVSPLVSGEANSSELTPATQSTAPLEVTPPNSVAPTPAEPTGVIAWILSNVLIFPDEQTSLPK
jgi:hypothetical protein